jgi:starvation-inducible DNA-binding protein
MKPINRLTKTAKLYNTENDLPKPTRETVVGLINQRLADIVDLKTQIKQAHWNVKGPHFIGLHKLFDEIAEDVEEYMDLIAERAVQLGGVAEGTARVAGNHSRLGEYPLKRWRRRCRISAVKCE